MPVDSELPCFIIGIGRIAYILDEEDYEKKDGSLDALLALKQNDSPSLVTIDLEVLKLHQQQDLSVNT